MKKHYIGKLISLVLCLCMIVPSVVAVAFAAEPGANIGGAATVTEGVNTPDVGRQLLPQKVDTVWGFDFAAMNGTLNDVYQTDKYGRYKAVSTNFALNSNGMTLNAEKDNGAIRVYEPKPYTITSESQTGAVGNSFFAGYDEGCLIMTVVVNFPNLPSVRPSMSKEDVLSFITLEHKYFKTVGATSKTTAYARFLCLDENGYLYDNNFSLMSSKHKLTAGEDETISIVMDPEPEKDLCRYALYLNGEYVFTSSVPIKYGVSGICESNFRFFNTSRQFHGAVLKSVSLHTTPEGYGMEDVADWTAYQTTQVSEDTQTFDLRLISLLDSLDHAYIGYNVSAVYRDADGNVKTRSYDDCTDTVYTSLAQTVDGSVEDWMPEPGEGEYILVMAIRGIDATLDFLEFRIRPYTLDSEGIKIYGKSTYLLYDGIGDDGYPVFSANTALVPDVKAEVTEDTCIRFGSKKSEVYSAGDKAVMCKWDGGYQWANTRAMLIKFDLTDLPEKVFEYTLNLYRKAGLSTQSTMKVTPVEPSYWEEGVVCGADFYQSATKLATHYPSWFTSSDKILTYTYEPLGILSFDISSYVTKAMTSGAKEISFLVEFSETAEEGMYAEFYTKEMSDGSYGAEIVARCSAFNTELNIEVDGNQGFEAWSYAERIVEDWWNNIFSIYEKNYNSNPVSDSKNYRDFTSSIKIGPSSADWSEAVDTPVRTVSSVNGYTALGENDTISWDSYGGLAADGGKYYNDSAYRSKVNGTPGFFGTYYDESNDRWWLITPEGNRFFSIGMCSVNSGMTVAQKALAQTVYDKAGMTANGWLSDLFNTYGLNTATGSVSSEYGEDELATGKYNINTHDGVSLLGTYAGELGLNDSVGGSTIFKNNNTLNVFDPDFVSFAYTRAVAEIEQNKNNPNRIGWTSDNEIPANTDMLWRYLTLIPPTRSMLFPMPRRGLGLSVLPARLIQRLRTRVDL